MSGTNLGEKIRIECCELQEVEQSLVEVIASLNTVGMWPLADRLQSIRTVVQSARGSISNAYRDYLTQQVQEIENAHSEIFSMVLGKNKDG